MDYPFKIPFSKFFLSHKGRAQDKQEPAHRDNVRGVSLTCSDGISGPFRLEIDWIAVELDENCTEEHAYEMYDGYKLQT